MPILRPSNIGGVINFGRWPLAVGRWLLAVGCWPLAVGCWPLAVGSFPNDDDVDNLLNVCAIY